MDGIEYYKSHIDNNGDIEKCYAFCEVKINDPSSILDQLDFCI